MSTCTASSVRQTAGAIGKKDSNAGPCATASTPVVRFMNSVTIDLWVAAWLFCGNVKMGKATKSRFDTKVTIRGGLHTSALELPNSRMKPISLLTQSPKYPILGRARD